MIGEKIQYAPNRDGKLISINEAKRGLACNCICPACKSVLIARKGDVRIPHFAHYKNNSCATGYQTSIHLLAKELINEKKMIKIPSIDCEVYHEDSNESEGYHSENKIIREERLLKNVQVYLEQKENGIIPDIIVQLGKYKLYVEIYVTHKVDESKEQIVKQNNISMLEIDLSEVNRDIHEDELKDELCKYLFEDTSKSKWINNVAKNIEYKKQQQIKLNLIKKHKEVEEKEEQERIKRWIMKGECPYCYSPFFLYKKTDGNIIIGCTFGCKSYYKKLSYEYKTIIRKKLEGTPAYTNRQWYVHRGKCPSCKFELVIKDGKYGPFVACGYFPRCKAKIEKELYGWLPNELKDEFNVKNKRIL